MMPSEPRAHDEGRALPQAHTQDLRPSLKQFILNPKTLTHPKASAKPYDLPRWSFQSETWRKVTEDLIARLQHPGFWYMGVSEN